MNEEEPEVCAYCGSPTAETGPPIWERYCTNSECTGERDALFAAVRAAREAHAKLERVRGAAPDMLSVLKFLLCVDFDNFTEHDEALLESVLADAKVAIAKAEGSPPPTSKQGT